MPLGCKDLNDATRLKPAKFIAPPPPITLRVTLPETVSVWYLAELLKLSVENVQALSGFPAPRSISFEQAQKILRNYGIGADRATS